MLHMGSTLGWGQEVGEGVAAQSVARVWSALALRGTSVLGWCAVEQLSVLVMQVCALLVDTGAKVEQTERPAKGQYDVQESGSGGNCVQNL